MIPEEGSGKPLLSILYLKTPEKGHLLSYRFDLTERHDQQQQASHVTSCMPSIQVHSGDLSRTRGALTQLPFLYIPKKQDTNLKILGLFFFMVGCCQDEK